MRSTCVSLALLAALASGCEQPEGAAPVPPAPTAEGPAAGAGPAAAPPSTDLPGRSIYQLGSTFTDAHGRPFELAATRGHPTVVLLFYGTCEASCPVLIEDVLRIDAALRPEA